MQLESNISKELEQWGWWAQDCPTRSLAFKSKVTLVPTSLDKSSFRSLSITDERALEIDRAIAELLGKDKTAIKAVKLYYVCGMSFKSVADAIGVSKCSAESLIKNSTSWLTGYLIGKAKK